MDADAQRKAAGERAAGFVEDGMVIGYGTGRGAMAALEALARRKTRVRGVPTSGKTVEICRRLGLAIVSLDDHPRLDLVLDGADEVDPQRNLLKGGGGAHVREKLVALASRQRIIVVEESKLVPRLGATRREGPPSDNGGVIVDAPLPASADLLETDRALKGIAGVVDHGLFLDLTPTVVIGGDSGVRVLSGG